MGVTVTIRRKFWRPLGEAEQVRQEILKAFPDLELIRCEPHQLFPSRMEAARGTFKIKTGGPLGFLIRLGLIWAMLKPQRPYFSGHLQGPGYAVEFFFEVVPKVRRISLTFYGSDWSTPGRHCDQLIANTGWMLKS